MDVLTPWFPASVKPVRPGMYLSRVDASDCFVGLIVWDGAAWHWLKGGGRLVYPRQWSGLAFDPSRAAECSDAETGEPGMWVPTK